MENVKFKKSLFGYKKRIINEYIAELNLKTQKMINDRDDEIYDLQKEKDALCEKVNVLTEKNNLVGEAIFAAEKKAQEIIEDAKKEAEKIKADADKEVEKSKKILDHLENEINELKAGLNASVTKYQSELDKLVSDK
ncbi:MAG: DivIVA domain-containing protein [Clostridia bacterium]|nr:DivIVA domain-containing protein [Clostridia bacterium]